MLASAPRAIPVGTDAPTGTSTGPVSAGAGNALLDLAPPLPLPPPVTTATIRAIKSIPATPVERNAQRLYLSSAATGTPLRTSASSRSLSVTTLKSTVSSSVGIGAPLLDLAGRGHGSDEPPRTHVPASRRFGTISRHPGARPHGRHDRRSLA